MNILNIIEVNEDEGRITICGVELGLSRYETCHQLRSNGYKDSIGMAPNATMVRFSKNDFPSSIGDILDSASVVFLHGIASPYINEHAKLSIALTRESTGFYAWLFGFYNDLLPEANKCFSDRDDDVAYIAMTWKGYSITAHCIDNTRYVINIFKGQVTFLLCEDIAALGVCSE